MPIKKYLYVNLNLTKLQYKDLFESILICSTERLGHTEPQSLERLEVECEVARLLPSLLVPGLHV